MRAMLALLLVCVAAGAAADPKSHYMIHCMGCHLADGKGQPPDVPAFDELLNRFLAIDGGRAYLVRVPGAAQSPLDDSALAGVLNWIVGEFGNTDATFRRFDAAEVASYRRHILSDPASERQALLLQLAGER